MDEIKNIPITDIADFDSVDVVELLVKAGDQVTIDQAIVTVESEKAMMDYPSPFTGTVEDVLVKEGDKIKEGDILLALKVAADRSKDAADEKPVQQAETVELKVVESNKAEEETKPEITATQTAPQPAPSTAAGYSSPGTNKYARELGININDVKGSGRNDRVIQKDIQQHVRENLYKGNSGALKPTKPLDFSAYGETRSEDLTKIQKLTADNMLNAWQSIPHVTHFDQADVTQLEVHRKQLANELKNSDAKLTPLVFVIKALVSTLKAFPQFNSSLDIATDKLIYKDFFHIGVAVDTPHGLFVPVLRDADKKSLEQLSLELIELSTLAKERKLTPKHMGGASMTISSLGILGGQSFTPIINPPEVAILGLAKIIIKDVMSADTNIEQRKLLPLSLSYDHRVINGADAARFCTHLKEILEDIWKLIL